MEKIIVISGSSRANSNTVNSLKTQLPWSSYELLELHKFKIEHYLYNTQKPQDDFLAIIHQMISADVIVFATPVYWYSMSGLMKVFFDRFTDLISTSKDLGRALKGKKTFLFATGSDTEFPPGFEIPFKKTSEYFEMIYEGSKYLSIKN